MLRACIPVTSAYFDVTSTILCKDIKHALRFALDDIFQCANNISTTEISEILVIDNQFVSLLVFLLIGINLLAIPSGHVWERGSAEEITHHISRHIAVDVRPPHADQKSVDPEAYCNAPVFKIINGICFGMTDHYAGHTLLKVYRDVVVNIIYFITNLLFRYV